VPPEAYLPEPRILTSIINLKPKLEKLELEKILKEIIQQSDKYSKNALREALIRTRLSSSKKEANRLSSSKKEAKKTINDLALDSYILESRVSRLSLNDLRILENKLHRLLG
jgi:16S rRNA A1518/A1519 N6-dimethyltransferase RsmA/KsgA/DIM1 with predicted DNA glycosylase/AP lyase activity